MITADPNTFEPVTCIMCRKVHYVNHFTGKVLGVGDNARPQNLSVRHAMPGS